MRIWPVLFLVYLAGCAGVEGVRSDPLPIEPGEPSPLARMTRGASPDGTSDRGAPELVIPSELDLAALLEAIEASPALLAERENVARETGLIFQGSYMPNPVLTLETEMMPIDDLGFGNARNKIRISQRFETAGKADSRVTLATAKRDEAEAAYFHKRQEMTFQATALLYAIQYTRELAEAQRRVVEIREKIEGLAEDLNRRGRLSDRDLIDYQVARGHAAVKVLDLEAEIGMKRGELEGLLGVPAGSIVSCRTAAPAWAPGDPKDAAEAILSSSCQLIMLDRKVLVARADLELRKSGAWEDVTVGLAYVYGDEMGREDQSFVGASIGFPLPLADRNQGAIEAGRAAVRQAEREIEAAAVRLLDEWHGLQLQWKALRANRELHEKTLLPALESSHRLAARSVEEGRVSVMDELQSALDLVQENIEILRLARSMSQIRAEINFITGERQV